MPSSAATVQRAGRFLVSGLLVTAFHALVAAGLIELFSLTPALANAIAFVMATIASYLANTLWSFSSAIGPGNLGRFIVVSLVGLGITAGVSGFISHLGWHYAIGIAAVVLTVPPATFLLHHFWTYR